jgi:hypothetical protein
VISNHQLTGFWFESGVEAHDDSEQTTASQFLAAALDVLQSSDPAQDEQTGGAIHTNFDPHLLSDSLPGHAWLKDRLRWMKQTFPAFDDEPGMLLEDPTKRRSPFPALHWSRRHVLEGRTFPLQGVQVLIGHDFVVIHEFRAILSALAPIPIADTPDTPLFSAHFLQHSGTAINLHHDWPEHEFASGRCPGFNRPLRVALRGNAGSYQGCLLVETDETSVLAQAKTHFYAAAYQTFLCTLLVNAAKVESEFDIAHDALDELRDQLDPQHTSTPLRDESVGSKSTAGESGLSHEATQRALYQFDQLVLTCHLNMEQFEQVSGQLLEFDNTWTKATRRRLRAYYENLFQAKKSTWKRFNDVEPQLPPPPKPRIRDQVFISYSHVDLEYLKDLKTHLNPYVKKFNNVGLDESMFWDDSRIKAGSEWKATIKEALDRSRAAIFLVSPDFLASKFINEFEIPELLKAQKKIGLLLCLIHIRSSSWEETPLEPYQALNNPKKPLQHLRTRRDEEWVKICKEIFEIIGPSATPKSS